MARGMCSTLSPDDATSYFEPDSFLISSQKYGLISLEKYYLDKIKVLFSEAKKSVFGKNFDTSPRGRTLSPNVPFASCIASHFVQFIPLFASHFPW